VLNIIVDETVNHQRFWDACSFIDQTNAAKIVLTIVSVFLLSLSLAHVAAFLRGLKSLLSVLRCSVTGHPADIITSFVMLVLGEFYRPLYSLNIK